jgi:type I restriction enzyme S subunit
MRIRDICYINKSNIKKDDQRLIYKYLETGDIYKNFITDIQEFTDKSLLPSRAKRIVFVNDIIISTVRPEQEHYGYIESSEQDLIVSTGFTVLSPKLNRVYPKYLYYFLTKEKYINYFQMIATSSVTSYPSITPDIIGNIKIDFPDLILQKELTKNIETVDRKISENRILEKMLFEYLDTLYKKWFVLFDYELNELGNIETKSLNMKEINGVKIPQGWDYISLLKICNKSTKSINPGKSMGTIYNYYNIPDFDKTGTYSLTNGSDIKSNKYIVENESLLISKINPWKKRIVLHKGEETAICSTEFVVLKAKKDNFSNFLYVLVNGSKFTRYCDRAAIGTSNSHKRVNPNYIMKFKFAFNSDVVFRFNNMIDPIICKLKQIKSQNIHLEEFKKLMILKNIN